MPGVIRPVNGSLRRATDKTIIISGRGPVGNRAQLVEVGDMLVAMRRNVALLKGQGKTLVEVVAAGREGLVGPVLHVVGGAGDTAGRRGLVRRFRGAGPYTSSLHYSL